MKTQSLPALCLIWLLKKEQVVLFLLAALVFCSSLGVVYSSFLTRQYYSDLQVLQAREDDLDGEYGRLLLEHSAWANYVRVEAVAGKELQMVSPEIDEMILVTDRK